MFERIANSWELVKASAKVLAADKELLIFPIISAIGTVIVTLTFALPLFLSGLVDQIIANGDQVVGFVVMFLFYVVQYTVIFFANTALAGAAMIRIKGGDPTVGDGFRIAFSRFGAIIGYALIAATVGMILRAISERSKGLGRFVVSLLGFAWNIATYLVVPILAVEGLNPIEAIKRSVQLLRKTWGEQIAGSFGIGAIFGIFILLLLLIGIPLIIYSFIGLELPWLGICGIILLIVLLMFTGLINSALSAIYTAAVYHYAVSGDTGQFFQRDLIEHAFITR